MKIEKREVKTYKEVFVAMDGTEFSNREECETYEKSATTVINGRFNALVKKVCSDFGDWLYMFSCEDTLFVVYIADENDLTAVNMWIQHHGAVGTHEANNLKLLGGDAIGTYQVLSDDGYGDYYFYGSLDCLKEWMHKQIDEFVEKRLTVNTETENGKEIEE